MRDLSILIRAGEDKVIEYAKILEPILSSRDCELIIINNTADVLNLKYKYTVYKFSGHNEKFNEFCFSSSIGKKVIIIDGSIHLNAELVDDILMQLASTDIYNTAYKFRKFLSASKPIYFIDTDILIYNRGIKGFNNESNIMVDDLTLLDGDFIDENFSRFMDYKHYNELYLWYKHTILSHLKDYKQHFYELLEFAKTTLEPEDRSKIEDLFINGNEDFEYCEYLLSRKKLFDSSIMNSETYSIQPGFAITSKNERYYYWLVYQIIKDRHDLINILFNTDLNLLSSIVEYLSGYNPFHEYLYDFILKTNQTDSTDEKIKLSKVNIMLIKAYISFASSLPVDPELKSRLLKLFDIYIQINKTLLENNDDFEESFDYYSDKDFTTKFKEALLHLENRDINKTAALLKSLSTEYPSFEMILRYYIQRLRSEYNCYKALISICMIVRDEEKNLNRCLSSLKPLLNSAAELIIVDTGSSDRTIEIAEGYAQKVYFYKWQGSFSDARNYSLSLAEGEYIFLLDADEEIEEPEIKKILNQFETSGYKSYSTYSLKIKNYTDIDLKEYAIITQPRIFKNKLDFYYSGKVHNQPVFQLPIKHLPAYITHYGYIMTEDIKDKKFQRTANMLKHELQKNPRNIYYRFQLSTSYAMHGDFKEALGQAEIYMRSIREEKNLNDNYLMHYNNAAILYISANQYDEASDICDEALKIKPDYIDFLYYKSLICFELEDYEGSLQYTKKYLALIDKFMSTDIANDGRYSFYSLSQKNYVIKLQILSNYMMGEYTEVINTLNSFKGACFKDCLHAIVHSFLRLSRYSDLIKFYNDHCNEESLKLIFRYFLKNFISKSGKREDAITSSILITLDCFEVHRDELRNRINYSAAAGINEGLYVVENYNVDSLNLYDARELFNRLLPAYISYAAHGKVDIKEVYRYKRLGSYILHRASELSRFRGYPPDKLINILQKYMSLSSYLVMNKRADLLEARERLFLIKITEAFKRLGTMDYNGVLSLLNQSTEAYREMKGLIKIILKNVLPNYKDSNIISKPVTIIQSSDEGIKSYASIIKEKIVEAVGKKNNRELLDIFNRFNRKELYDSELFSYRAVLLMSESFFNEAELEIKEGLKKYKNDVRLLTNLSRLYSLTHRFDKSFEIYCKVRMLSRDNCPVQLNELIPEEYLTSKANTLKVLHGTMFADDTIKKITSELSSQGIFTKTLNYSPKYTGYTQDYCIDMNQYENGYEIIAVTLEAASRLIPRYDIFHFHFGNTLTFDYSDLPLLNELGKKVIVQFWGDEVKIPLLTSSLYKDKAQAIHKKLLSLSKHVSHCIVPNKEICGIVENYFKKIYIIKENETDKLIALYKALIGEKN